MSWSSWTSPVKLSALVEFQAAAGEEQSLLPMVHFGLMQVLSVVERKIGAPRYISAFSIAWVSSISVITSSRKLPGRVCCACRGDASGLKCWEVESKTGQGQKLLWMERLGTGECCVCSRASQNMHSVLGSDN